MPDSEPKQIYTKPQQLSKAALIYARDLESNAGKCTELQRLFAWHGSIASVCAVCLGPFYWATPLRCPGLSPPVVVAPPLPSIPHTLTGPDSLSKSLKAHSGANLSHTPNSVAPLADKQ